MRILVACEESQVVTIELRKLGHEAYSCDIIPPSGGHPEWHLQQDVLPLLERERWDMIIAFPPCTYLSNAGARHLFPKGQLNLERYQKGLAGKEFFLKFLNADCPRIAVENPGSSKIYNMPPYTQEIQPWQFGHPYTKRTRLWLKGLPLLQPTNIVKPIAPWVNAHSNQHAQAHNALTRSKTFPGIAKAMAEQWTKETKEHGTAE